MLRKSTAGIAKPRHDRDRRRKDERDRTIVHITFVAILVWWAVWLQNARRAAVAGNSYVYLNVFAQFLNGGGRTVFVEAANARASVASTAALASRRRAAAAVAAFACENLSHMLACVSIALLLPSHSRHMYWVAAAEVAVNVAFLARGLFHFLEDPEEWHRFFVWWRRSLPLTTAPVVGAMWAAGALSPAVLRSVVLMAVSRGLGIFLSDHWLVDAHDGRATASALWKRAWFAFSAVGAWAEMNICLALVDAPVMI